MKRTLIVIALLSLAGCIRPPEEWVQKNNFDLKMIKGLEDCTYREVNTGSSILHVIRCPNSSVSTLRGGKGPVRTITIDGTEYVEKQ